MDARLGNGHSALFHHLVDGCAIDIAHLVELIDADDAAIGQDHGTRL